MVLDLTKLMFEKQGEPGQLKNEIGHLFIVDRGKRLLWNYALRYSIIYKPHMIIVPNSLKGLLIHSFD